MLLFPILACAGAFISDFALNNYVSKTSLISLCFRGAPYLSDSHKSYSSRKKLRQRASVKEMDFRAKFKWALGEMEWEDVISTLEAMVTVLLKDASIPTYPRPPPVFAVFQSDVHPHPLEDLSGGHCECTTLEAAPNWFQQPSPVQTALGPNKLHTRHSSYNCVTITPLVMAISLAEHVDQHLHPVDFF